MKKNKKCEYGIISCSFFLLLLKNIGYNKRNETKGGTCLMSQLFEPQVYQNGQKYVKNNQVSTIKKTGNLFHASIYGAQHYHVVIAKDRNNQIIGMNCTCAIAQTGKKCAHEAAVYIKMNLTHTAKNKTEDTFSLQELYKKYILSYHPPQYNRFFELVNIEMDQLVYNQQGQTNIEILSHIRDMMMDMVTFDFPQKFQNKKATLFSLTFSNLLYVNLETNFEDEFIQWIIDILTIPQYLPINNLFFEALEQLPQEMIYSLCYRLIHQKEIQAHPNILSYIAFYVVQYASEDISEELLELLKDSPESEVYQYVIIIKLMAEEKFQLAYNTLHKYISDKEIVLMKDAFSIIESRIYFELNDIQKYQQYTYQYYASYQDQYDLSLLNNLKTLYDSQWSIEKYKIYDYLNQIMEHRTFIDIIYKMDEWQWVIYHVLENPSFHILDSYSVLLKKQDFRLYLFLYQVCLISFIDEFGANPSVAHYIFNLQIETIDERVYKEIIFNVCQVFKNDKVTCELLREIDVYEDIKY